MSAIRAPQGLPPRDYEACRGCGKGAMSYLCRDCAKELDGETLSTLEGLSRKLASAPAGKFGFHQRQLEMALEDAGRRLRGSA